MGSHKYHHLNAVTAFLLVYASLSLATVEGVGRRQRGTENRVLQGSLATALEERTGAGAADNKNFSKRSSDGQCVQGPPGTPGRNGIHGIPGIPGSNGARGEVGQKGDKGDYPRGPRPVHIGSSTATCTEERAGLLRYVASKGSLQLCDGNDWRSLVTEETQPGGAPTSAGKSCADIKAQNQAAKDGIYWVNPDPSVYIKPFQIYCDMTTAGGGWSMCYTTDFAVRLKTGHVFNSHQPFGSTGYRGDCRNIPFKEVLYISHADQQVAWFSKTSAGHIVTSHTNYDVPGNTYGLWTPHGVASRSYNYQFLLCDKSDQKDFYPGYFISGYTNCFKKCNNWCSDRSTPYFRTDGDSAGGSYDGVAFNTNGHHPLGRKLMSVGLRL